MRRVVVTGMGALTPIGHNVEELWEGIKEGRIGFGENTSYDFPVGKEKLVAEVKNFDASDYMDSHARKRMDLFAQYAVAATKEAIESSKLDMEKEDPYQVGCILGSAIGSVQAVTKNHERLLEGYSKVLPMFIPKTLSNMAAGNVAIQYGLKGKNFNVVTACASGTNAIGEAYRSIQFGEADVMIAGGTEGAICPVVVSGFGALTATSNSRDPKRCSIPFDLERNGFVMGEGAGIVVLEELGHALNRKADIFAEVIGYGSSCDASHITLPEEDGSGAARAMENAIKESGINKEDIIYINAHGTSTKANDLFETRAIKKVFKEHAAKLKINSTKSMIGHLLGAAGGVEFIVCVKTILNSYIHPTVGYEKEDPELGLDYIMGEGLNMAVEYALSNSLGFGGHNASLLIRKYKG